ncbi:MAG: hypothetical protein HY820_39630 [Acidobacteria bacterium]|nr:hypothetical protein [Acidobacteriota bacterium]
MPYTRRSFLALSSALAAESHPNLTGEWQLNFAKSDLGPQPPPDRWIRRIRHQEPSLTITTIQQRGGQQVQAEFTLTTDGKEARFQMGGNDASGSARWDGATLLIMTTRNTPAGPIQQNERATLSAGGKTLTFAVTIIYDGNEVKMKLVFEKA